MLASWLGVLAAILTAQVVVAASPPANPGPTSARVAVEDFAFTPASITIAVGGSVVWAVRKDPEQHTVTPVEPDSFVGSGQLLAGDDYTVTFAEPGRHDYVCSLHPFMTGTVIVETAAATQTAPPAASGSDPASALVPVPSASVDPTVEPTLSGASGPPSMVVVAVVVAIVLGLGFGLVAARQRRRPSG